MAAPAAYGRIATRLAGKRGCHVVANEICLHKPGTRFGIARTVEARCHKNDRLARQFGRAAP